MHAVSSYMYTIHGSPLDGGAGGRRARGRGRLQTRPAPRGRRGPGPMRGGAGTRGRRPWARGRCVRSGCGVRWGCRPAAKERGQARAQRAVGLAVLRRSRRERVGFRGTALDQPRNRQVLAGRGTRPRAAAERPFAPARNRESFDARQAVGDRFVGDQQPFARALGARTCASSLLSVVAVWWIHGGYMVGTWRVHGGDMVGRW